MSTDRPPTSTSGRGGSQLIPRPPEARPGSPAPWHALDADALRLDLPRIEVALRRRGPGRFVAGHVEPGPRQSAVLVPLFESGGEPHVLLTRRASNLRSHRSEVSFPGGRHDPGDTSLWHTALRETHEEIGLDASDAHPIGELDKFVTVGSASLVHPFVAVVDEPGELMAQPDEVEAILRVPLSELLSAEVFREELWPIGGRHRPITFFELVGDTVWGATAAMLRQLLAVATGTDDTLTR